MLKPICVNGSNCQGSSALPPCVGDCGGGGSSGGGSFPTWDINDAYPVDTIVIRDGVLYAANSDIPPGTPFEVGDIPGTWRAVQAGSASIPPFNPESSYAQYRAVLYEGRIYISNAALIPGAFNPANWTEVLVTGAVGTNDTVTINMEGNGTAGDPLLAYLNLDPSDTNLLQITEDGLLFDSSQIPPSPGSKVIISEGVTMNVDAATGDDTAADGTLSFPFATIQAALDAATAGDVVQVWPGAYAVPANAKGNTTLKAAGGTVTLSSVLNVRVPNFRVLGDFVIPDIVIEGSSGGVVLDGVTVSNYIIFGLQNSGTYLFKNVNLVGGLTAIDNTNQGNVAMTVIMSGEGTGSPAINTDIINGRFYVGKRQNVGNVLHRRGLLVIEDVVRVQNIDHTAPAASTNLLYVKNVSNFNPQTGAFATVSKTGDAAFIFNNFARDASTDETAFEGTKTLIEQARDIHGNYIPVNYTAANSSIPGHLKGIDDALNGNTGVRNVNLAFSLVGGWDADEILFAYVVPQDTTFPPDLEGSYATADVTFDSTIILSQIEPGGGAAQQFGTVTFSNGAVTFSGGGNTAPEGATIILQAGDSTADFGFLALTLLAEVVI